MELQRRSVFAIRCQLGRSEGFVWEDIESSMGRRRRSGTARTEQVFLGAFGGMHGAGMVEVLFVVRWYLRCGAGRWMVHVETLQER